MNTSFAALLGRRRLIITATVILSLMGVFSWFNMPRQEDPKLPDYWGNIQATFPGADAETVERLILNPLEEHLAEREEIKYFEGTALAEIALVHVELRQGITDIDDAWEKVEESIEEAREDFPEGAGSVSLNDEIQKQESIVLAITGSADPMELLKHAKDIKDDLLTLATVAEVLIVADPEEQVTIEYDDALARRLDLDPRLLSEQLTNRNLNLPGGSIKLGGKAVSLRPRTDFMSLDEIRETQIVLPSGSSVPLSEIAKVRYGPKEPSAPIMRFNGELALGIGIVPSDSIHLVNFGKQVRAKIEAIAPKHEPLKISEITFQPDRVQKRLSNLGSSLLLGVMIVAGVLLLAMGPRLGLVVASVVPLVALASLAIYSLTGGVLQQISIAALVIALGMLVDNAIVIVENVQWRMDQGNAPKEAAVESVKELAAPLASATGTTLAAFVPILMAKGGTAAFTRALPIVVMLTLAVSYFFAVLVSPVLSEVFLKPRKKEKPFATGGLAQKLALISIRRAPLVLGTAFVVVFVVAGLPLWFASVRPNVLPEALQIKRQFFPNSDRDQVIVEVKLPEGAHLNETERITVQLERALMAHGNVRQVSSYIGRSVPHFYYNLGRVPLSPHFAQLIVNTVSVGTVPGVIEFIRETSRREWPEAQVIASKLEQGPRVDAPIELRVYGQTFDEISQVADNVLKKLREIEGTVDVRHDVSLGAPQPTDGCEQRRDEATNPAHIHLPHVRNRGPHS